MFVMVKSKLNIFGDLNYKKINFNCTTDTYTKPSIYECSKCRIIFSELIFKMDENEIEKNYQDVSDDKYISQIKFKNIILKNFVIK